MDHHSMASKISILLFASLFVISAICLGHVETAPNPERLHLSVLKQNCTFEYRPSGISLDIKKIINGTDFVEVPQFTLNGNNMSMLIGLCKGISGKSCQGKANKGTGACLIDHSFNTTTLDANNSKIVGSIQRAGLKLKDGRLVYLINHFDHNTNNTKDYKFEDVRVEFFCANETQSHPNFVKYENNTYVFEWAWKEICDALKSTPKPKVLVMKDDHFGQNVTSSTTSSASHPPLSDKDLKINFNSELKTAKELHDETHDDSKKILEQSSQQQHQHQQPSSSSTTTTSRPSVATKPSQHDTDKREEIKPKDMDRSEESAKMVKTGNTSSNQDKDKQNNDINSKPSSAGANKLDGSVKMNKLHKFFMISLIVVSLAGFVVLIFILDKKTRLRIPLSNIRRQARQALQPQTPYTRVDSFHHHLDI